MKEQEEDDSLCIYYDVRIEPFQFITIRLFIGFEIDFTYGNLSLSRVKSENKFSDFTREVSEGCRSNTPAR